MDVSVGTKAAVTRKVGAQGSNPRHNPLWRLKLRLQFTGWLQYIANGAVALIFLAVAIVGGLIGVAPLVLFWLPGAVALILLAFLAFDLVTVKLGIRPAESIPRPKDDLDAFDLMRGRRSCRSFQSRDLTDAHRQEILDVALEDCRPDHLVGTSRIRLEYVAAPLTVWPAVGAHEFLIAIAPKRYDRLAVIDVGRSLQHLVLQATRLGIATCWIGPGADHSSILKHLGDRFDPENDHIICVCAIGYRSRFMPLFVHFMELVQHRRLPLSSLFFADDHYSEPLAVDKAPWSAFGRCYEVCQWSPSSYNSQTTRCAAVTGPTADGRQTLRFDFAAATDSRYYAAIALGIWCADWESGCEALGITGHFGVLTPQQRGVMDAPALPRYDVSWVVDGSMSLVEAMATA